MSTLKEDLAKTRETLLRFHKERKELRAIESPGSQVLERLEAVRVKINALRKTESRQAFRLKEASKK